LHFSFRIIDYNNYIEKIQSQLMMLSAITRISPIKKALKFAFSGLSLFFIGMLVFMVIHDLLTGASSETSAEYCAKYSILASPACW
jgi:hypothetical protein